MKTWCASALLLCGCFSAPPAPPPPHDETKDAWYKSTVAQLSLMAREADADFKAGKPDDASALIEKGEPMISRLLGVPRPTLEAMQASSDLEDLYARMLYSNRNFGWARLMYQKNVARWKYWTPQTSDTAIRLKQAQDGIQMCDKSISE